MTDEQPMRQVGADEPINCAWCHLPASWIWAVVDEDGLDYETPTCLRCEEFIDGDEIPELVKRGVREWARLADPSGVAGRDDELRATMTAQIDAWLTRRVSKEAIPWEMEGRCPRCDEDRWHTIESESETGPYRCIVCGLSHHWNSREW